MVEALLWMAHTGIQWRYLPARFPPWPAVRSEWRRWRANTVWEKAMGRLARTIWMDQDRHAEPSMVMVDAQTAKGGRAGPTFHDAGGRGGWTFGSKRTILVDILGLPFACRVDPARPHYVASAGLLLTDELPALPRLPAVVADRAYRGLGRLAAKRGLALDIKVPPKGLSRFVPIGPLYKVEHAFAQLGRWRQLSRRYEQTEVSARPGSGWPPWATSSRGCGRARLSPPHARPTDPADRSRQPCSPGRRPLRSPRSGVYPCRRAERRRTDQPGTRRPRTWLRRKNSAAGPKKSRFRAAEEPGDIVCAGHIVPERGEKLGRGEVTQSLVGAHVVVDGLPGAELSAQDGDRRLAVGEPVELLGVSPVGPLDGPVELRGAGRQDEQPDPARGTGGLELGHELTPVVDADGAHRKRHALAQGLERGGRERRRRAAPQFEDVRSGRRRRAR